MSENNGVQLDPALQAGAAVLLKENGFHFRSQDHAFWHADKGGTHVIFYRSGSVLFQGGSSAEWKSKLAMLAGPGRKQAGGQKTGGKAAAELGLDESGKGDYFGPLVLAGAVVSHENSRWIMEAGVRDSKKLSDGAVREIFERISPKLHFHAEIIEPAEYNTLYRRHKNLNRLMVDRYSGLIGKFKESVYERAILDRFAMSAAQKNVLLGSTGREMLIEVRAERHLPVAAASVIARFYFLDWLDKAGKKYGIEFPKGSGPAAGDLFRRLKDEWSAADFSSVAKTHFKSGDGGGLF